MIDIKSIIRDVTKTLRPKHHSKSLIAAGVAFIMSVLSSEAAFAQDVVASVNKGDTTWILVSTMVVLFMTVPGLGLFYGGLLRAKNMLSMLMQVGMTMAIGMIAWILWGYSFAFTDSQMGAFIGGFDRIFLNGVTLESTAATYSAGVELPEYIYIAFQMTFAAITPAVIYGATAERMKFSASIIFAILWPLLSYYPIAHMVWFGSGLLFKMGALDFAGGTVVHINAGFSALIACLILGARSDYKNSPTAPHSLVMNYVGAGMLWIGWLGFNGGSNLEGNAGAALVVINTLLAAAGGAVSWAATEWIFNKRASLLGYTSGLVAGLVAITPACGVVSPIASLVLGLLVSPLCLLFVVKVKQIFKYDDSLDVFGIHGVGGVFGAIMTGVLCSSVFGGIEPKGYSMLAQVIVQTKAVIVSAIWSSVSTVIVLTIIKYSVGLRASADDEEEGLDTSEHGERAYHI